MMYRIVIILIVIIIGGSYILPANIAGKIPYGPDIQRIAKTTVSWSVDTLDGLTSGWLTDALVGLKERGGEELDTIKGKLKESVKDAVKDQIDEF